MVNENRPGVIVLSRNGTSPYEFPADIGDPFPDGATVHAVFTNTLDEVVADISGQVYPTRAQFMFAHADVSEVKRGFNFEVFINIDDVEYAQRYGKVVRREPSFEYTERFIGTRPVYLADNFTARVGNPGSLYIPTVNAVAIHNNGLFGAPNALAQDLGLFYDTAAVRVQKSLATDSARMQVTMVNGGVGETKAVFCANSNLTTFMGIMFDANNTAVRLVSHNGIVANGITDSIGVDAYTLDYNHQTKMLKLSKNGGDTIVEWEDTDDTIPHGRGYRNIGFSWIGSVLSTGPQLAAWEAMDYVGA